MKTRSVSKYKKLACFTGQESHLLDMLYKLHVRSFKNLLYTLVKENNGDASQTVQMGELIGAGFFYVCLQMKTKSSFLTAWFYSLVSYAIIYPINHYVFPVNFREARSKKVQIQKY